MHADDTWNTELHVPAAYANESGCDTDSIESYPVSRSKGGDVHSWFVIGKSRVRLPSLRPTNPIEAFIVSAGLSRKILGLVP
jgi:hypothetical protein